MSNSPHDARPSLEEQVALLKQQLLQAQKLTAMGELVSSTTHEFNNVLMTIINYAKLGLRQQDQASRDKAFEKILAAGNRAAKITTGVLGFARNRSDAFEPTDLGRVIDDSLLLLDREMAKYRIKVNIDKPAETPPLAWANGNQIQQVLLNLLINARQAMLNGGQIFIRLAFDPATQMLDLSVRDTGGGIPPETLRRIFDPFFTTKSGPDATGKGGTGVGLSMCRNIIEAHHGRIRVESTVGRGTSFTLRIPTQRPNVAPFATPPSVPATTLAVADTTPAPLVVPIPASAANPVAAPAANQPQSPLV